MGKQVGRMRWTNGLGWMAASGMSALLVALLAAPLALAQAKTPAPGSNRAAAKTAPTSGGETEAGSETEAERETRKIREAQKRLRKMEEMFLRTQLEQQLNQIARWNADRAEIELKKRDLGGLEIPLELLLEEIAEPRSRGRRLRFKPDVKVRPFALAVQGYMASGGMEDVQRVQRGESPFAGGVPPRVYTLVANLLQALNDQADGERAAEAARLDEERKAMQDEVARQLGIAPEQVEVYGRVVRQVIRQLERQARGADPGEAVARLQRFAESPRGQRLGSSVLESDAVQKTLRTAEDSVLALLETDAGAQLADRFERFLASERGRPLRRRLERMGRTRAGQRFLRRWEERPRRERVRRERSRRQEREPGREPSPF